MHWTDDGLILSARKYGENSVILHALTREHGRYAGMVRGGAGKRLRGIIQPGNEVGLQWHGRLSEQLGTFKVEAGKSTGSALYDKPLHLSAFLSVLALIDKALPEREPHPMLFEATLLLAEQMEEDICHWGALMVRWELGLLTELGYGLDLSECAATGVTEDLIYVSPKSGRAVSAHAGEPYKGKLLSLPVFLQNQAPARLPELTEIFKGFQLSGFFLQKYLLPNYREETLPARERFLSSLVRQIEKSSS